MVQIANCILPLDGDSLGVAAALALLSLVVEDKEPDEEDDDEDDEEGEGGRCSVVTGAMDLTGKVLPVGGLAGKLQVSAADASRQAGGSRRFQSDLTGVMYLVVLLVVCMLGRRAGSSVRGGCWCLPRRGGASTWRRSCLVTRAGRCGTGRGGPSSRTRLFWRPSRRCSTEVRPVAGSSSYDVVLLTGCRVLCALCLCVAGLGHRLSCAACVDRGGAEGAAAWALGRCVPHHVPRVGERWRHP